MSTDPTIRDQTYTFFLMEAPELLQTIEHDLLSLMEDHSTAKVHNLMRITHTLKGAAASVGLETIKTVAHSLEDVFKALYNPAVVFDPELETLLFQGYECLRLPLSAEFTGTEVNELEVLNRAASVFAQLQSKLGDLFDQEAQIPSSAELGFDITESIFATGVEKRLENLAAALVNPEIEKVATMLQEQASVFLGLAESLGLPGFGAIAQTTIAALEAHPDQAVTIAQIALADLQRGKAAVLSGDRSRGGEPDAALLELAQPTAAESMTDATKIGLTALEPPVDLSPDQLFGGVHLETNPLTAPHLTPPLPETTPTLGALINGQAQDLPLHLLEPTHAEPASPVVHRPQEPAAPAQMVRVDLEKLQRLNHLAGELLTNQNRQGTGDEQLQETVQRLRQQLAQHQQILSLMRDWSDRLVVRSERQRDLATLDLNRWSARFDTLEMNPSGEFHVLLQSAMEQTVELEETTEAIALFTQQSSQTLEKQRRLLTHIRDDLMTAQMSPLGEVFNRFKRVLQQLVAVYGKPVELQISGADLLVDKTIADKLYDPILHLVRNAFDHGIESLEVRHASGKPETGQIRIHAYQQDRWMMIALSDDGKGLDFEQIRDRAREMNLLEAGEGGSLVEAQLLKLLFKPGFSTAAQISDLSGRGIGLDVVRTQIEALQGSISIQSKPQQGTTFLLQIPLTITIAKLLVCQAGGQVYAFLTDAIEQILLPQPDQIRDWRGQRVLHWRKGVTEQMVPVRKLSDLMQYTIPLPLGMTSNSLASPAERAAPLFLLRQGTELLGLEVDQVIGEQELVIRPVGNMITPPPYVQGCCILADGRLTLMIDTSVLLGHKLPKTTDRPVLTQNCVYPTEPFPAAAIPQATLTQILVVDDSITLRQNLALVLQRAGYQVLQARDGQEAIAQLQQNATIQLVISDVEMPGMNGFEFLSHRSQSPDLTEVPVVMLTSRSSEKHRQLALELGANGYLTKPYLDQELLTIVKNAINQSMPNPIPS
jgi:chemotaxis protein histidine kinase CheA/ActR/RegA family two-component response regulator